MNTALIRNWNERVKPEDLIFNVGDFCFKNSAGGKVGEGIPVKAREWEEKLNGKIIHIKGNHDRNNSTKTLIEKMGIKYGHKRINLVHNPEYVDLNYKINFVGHIHKNWKIKRIKRGFGFTDAINVGVDVWSYYPITFEEIMKRYNQWKKELKREFKSN
jgi:calcineurin-like phosphoesterase family protein